MPQRNPSGNLADAMSLEETEPGMRAEDWLTEDEAEGVAATRFVSAAPPAAAMVDPRNLRRFMRDSFGRKVAA